MRPAACHFPLAFQGTSDSKVPIFAYKATAPGGRVVKGEIAAENDRQARTLIRETGATPITMRERSPSRAHRPASGWLASFSRQFGTLLKAGFPVDRALSVLAASASDASARTVLAAMDEGVRRGLRVSDAVSRAMGLRDMGLSSVSDGASLASRSGADVSSGAVAAGGAVGGARELVAILEAGEAAGDLSPVLLNFADLLERRLLFRRRLRSALFYPMIVAGIAVAVVVFLFVYVVPTITKLFDGTNLPLPLPTKILIWSADIVRISWAPGIIIALVLAWALRRWLATTRGSRRAEELAHGLPILGDILEKAAFARWARTFGTLLKNHVEILTALDIAARTASSMRIQAAMAAARPRVAEGVPLAKAVQESGIFPPIAVEAVMLGETSGALPQLLIELATAWEGDVETSAERMADLLEPLVLVGMGLIVGGIVLAVLLPIFEFNSAVH